MTDEWNKDYPEGLPVLLYPLFHIENPRRIPILPPAGIEKLKSLDNLDKLRRECGLLNWALEHQDFDYKSILDFPYSNDEIVSFIHNLADLYEHENIFDLFGLECVEKLIKTKLEKKYFQDNYIDTPNRLGYVERLFSGIGKYAFPSEKKLPPKYLQKYLGRWGTEGYPAIREQLEWCKEHPHFDYAEFLSLGLSNVELIKRFDEIDEYLAHLESKVEPTNLTQKHPTK